MQEEQAAAESIDRIARMERLFDEALGMEPEDLRGSDLLKELMDYYDSGLWLQDYTLDEQGKLPENLKRGVLSQDGMYNLLEEINV